MRINWKYEAKNVLKNRDGYSIHEVDLQCGDTSPLPIHHFTGIIAHRLFQVSLREEFRIDFLLQIWLHFNDQRTFDTNTLTAMDLLAGQSLV